MSGALNVSQLSVSYYGRPAVSEVSLAVGAVTITTLLGPNGAGKSSLVQAIAGVVPASGSLEINGAPMRLGRPDSIRRAGVAVVSEGHRVLTQLSVSDNLLVASVPLKRSERRTAIAGALTLFPELDPLLRRDAGSLSGGEQQMLALAQALIPSPCYLIVDELSLGLAPVIVRRLAGALRTIAEQGTGILLIEQFTDLALELASVAYVMARGRIVLAGATAELRSSQELLKTHYLSDTSVLRTEHAPEAAR
jgi:branched-chain amino acid transport system ATP-binding protein